MSARKYKQTQQRHLVTYRLPIPLLQWMDSELKTDIEKDETSLIINAITYYLGTGGRKWVDKEKKKSEKQIIKAKYLH